MAYGSSNASPVGQGRESRFRTSSPHSSSGVADSFKGTPDTRVTSFSPSNTMPRSAKAPVPLSIITRGATPVKFAMAVTEANNQHEDRMTNSSGNVRTFLNLKDPFVSSSTLKAMPKLSPTASSFFPNHAVATSPRDSDRHGGHGPSDFKHCHVAHHDAQPGLAKQDLQAPEAPSQQIDEYIHSYLSTESGLSRCFVVSKQGATVKAAEVQAYVAVRRISSAVYESRD